MKTASQCTARDLVENNVVSSRIRLARNVEGLAFPNKNTLASNELLEVVKGAARAAEGMFEGDVYFMSKLDKMQKQLFVERHLISLPLANNDKTGAVILERSTHCMSIMLNEEDHIREQCVMDGFSLREAYERLDRYDDALIKQLPIAYDSQLGFLTACPTNLGTGMRASAMLFLPALKRAGAIEDALATFKNEYGLTIRGIYGEGSEAFCDIYQISNSRTLGVDEKSIINTVEKAVVQMCYCERVALEKLVKEQSTKLFDGILRSYGLLMSAYSLSSQELMRLIVDVKLGVILDILPKKHTVKQLDTLANYVSKAVWQLTSQQLSDDVWRAKEVKRILMENL